jgi:hypothetical protein
MKYDTPKPHPGPFRFMRVDAEFAGIMIAVGFTIMGLVGLPIAKWFLLAAIALAVLVATILHFGKKHDLDLPHFIPKQ